MKTIKLLFVAGLLSIAGIIISGCSKGELYGEAIPEDMEITKIKSILSDPDSFTEKEVKIEGTLGQVCPSGCWFFVLDEGGGKIYVDINPAGLAIPPKSKGKVAVVGTVKKAGRRLGIYGKGVKLL